MDAFTVVRAAQVAREPWKNADAEVAAAANEQGVTKEEAWAGVHAALLFKRAERGRAVLDRLDPLGWRAAAQAVAAAERAHDG